MKLQNFKFIRPCFATNQPTLMVFLVPVAVRISYDFQIGTAPLVKHKTGRLAESKKKAKLQIQNKYRDPSPSLHHWLQLHLMILK